MTNTTNDNMPRWSTNDILDAFNFAGYAEHDAAIILATLEDMREINQSKCPANHGTQCCGYPLICEAVLGGTR